jgi:hypothetical protein
MVLLRASSNWVSILLVLLLCSSVDGTESQNGTATTTFVTMDVLETITYSFYGEGMAYDVKRDRFLFGSLQLGTLLAVPRAAAAAAAGKTIAYAQEDLTFVLSERPAAFNGSNFLGLEMDPLDPDLVWGCVAYGPTPVVGVARVNLTDSRVDFFDLSDMANPDTGSHAVLNDLAFSPDGAFLFITDTWGYQVLRLRVASGQAEVWGDGAMYCTDCLTTEPHFDGPNGIVYVSSSLDSCDSSSSSSSTDAMNNNYNSDYLLIALGASSRRLLKVNVSVPHSTPAAVQVQQNAGSLDDMVATYIYLSIYIYIYIYTVYSTVCTCY